MSPTSASQSSLAYPSKPNDILNQAAASKHRSSRRKVSSGSAMEMEGIEDEADASDEEVEGLLRQGASSVTNSPNPASSTTARRTSATIPRARSASRWKSEMRKGVRGMGMNGMSKAERSLFLNEMLTQTLPTLLVSLIGSLFTGELLSNLQTWKVFIRVEELFILVPILLNLKGNLEMNLASRFSTSANIGELDLRLTRRSLILGNLALLQVQALLVSLLSGLLSFGLGILSRNGIQHPLQHPIHDPSSAYNSAAGGSGVTDALRGGYFEVLLVLCVGMLAAGLSSVVLGSFMCSLVVLSRRWKVNPDNFATPLATALGDLLTLIILGIVSSVFATFMGTFVSTFVFILLLGVIAVNVVLTFRNAYVQELLTIGWTPLFVAMLISSGTGLVLKASIKEFPGFALFSPVITALAGNAGSIFTSRISTALHASKKEHYLIVAVALFSITCPVLFLFLGFVAVSGMAKIGLAFAGGFIVVVAVQVALSLFVAYRLSLLLWKWDYDPDVYALPLLSSGIDCVGQLMLLAVFAFARRFDAVAEIPSTGVI